MKNNMLYRLIVRFIRDEQGVYALIMALTGIFLFVAIAFAFELSGMLMDKARLSDGLEQATLTLTAENNQGRLRAKLAGDQAIQKRDKQIVDQYVMTYLPNHSDPNFTVHCETSDTIADRYGSNKKGVKCDAQGQVQRHNWFPISFGLDTIVPERSQVGSEGLAVKVSDATLPKDIMIVMNLDYNLYTPSRSVGGLPEVDCYGFVPERVVGQYAEWTKRNCAIGKGRLDPIYKDKNFNPKNVLYVRNEVQWAINDFLRELSKRTGPDSNHVRVAFFPFGFGGQVRSSAETSQYCLIPFVAKSKTRFREAFENSKKNEPYFVYARYNKEGIWDNHTSKLYIQPAHEFNMARIEDRFYRSFAELWFSVDWRGGWGRYRNSFRQAAYIAKYLPDYVDIDATIARVSRITPRDSHTEFKISPHIDSLACMSGLIDDKKDGDPSPYEGKHTGRQYQMSSNWFGMGQVENFLKYVDERVRKGPAVTNIASGLIAATQQFVVLGRNPALKPEQPTERLMFVILTGNNQIEMSNGTWMAKEHIRCPDDPNTFSVNQDGIEVYPMNKDGTAPICRPYVDWLDKQPRYRSGSSKHPYRWVNDTRGLDKMTAELIGKRVPGTEHEFNEQTGSPRYPDAQSSALCHNIRRRLDAIDKDVPEEAGNWPRAKIHFFLFQTGYRLSRQIGTALRSCMPDRGSQNAPEVFIHYVNNEFDFSESMIKLIEESKPGEEVGFSRTRR